MTRSPPSLSCSSSLAAARSRSAAAALVYAQLEGADRGVPPIDSASNFEVTGIQVDVAGRHRRARRASRAGARPSRRAGRRCGRRPTAGPIERGARPHRIRRSTRSSPASSSSRSRSARSAISPGSACCSTAPAPASCSASQRLGPPLGADAGHPGDADRLVRPQLRIAQRMAAGLGAVPHRRQPGRLCPADRAPASIRCCSTPPRRGGRGRGWWRMLLDQYGAADVVIPEVAARARSIRAARRSASSPPATAPTTGCSAASRLRVANSAAHPAHARRGRAPARRALQPGARRRPASARSDPDRRAAAAVEELEDGGGRRRPSSLGDRDSRRRPVGAAPSFSDPGRHARRRPRSAARRARGQPGRRRRPRRSPPAWRSAAPR